MKKDEECKFNWKLYRELFVIASLSALTGVGVNSIEVIRDFHLEGLGYCLSALTAMLIWSMYIFLKLKIFERRLKNGTTRKFRQAEKRNRNKRS